MIRIDRARRLDVVVERAGHLVVGRERQPDQLGQRRDVVRQVGDEILVVLAFDQGRIVDRSDVLSRVVNVDVDRVLELAWTSGSGVTSGSAGCSGASR